SVCASIPFSLQDTGFTTGNGIAYQWEYSVFGTGIWDTLPGGHSPTYTFPSGIAQTFDFRFAVTCTNGGAVDYSNVLTVSVNPFYECYCSPKTGTILHSTPNNYITQVQIPGTTLNNNTSGGSAGAGGYTYFP